MSTIVALKGWNSSLTPWGSSTWGGEVAFTGATASVGSIAIDAEGNVGVFGVAGTGAVGTVTVNFDFAVLHLCLALKDFLAADE